MILKNSFAIALLIVGISFDPVSADPLKLVSTKIDPNCDLSKGWVYYEYNSKTNEWEFGKKIKLLSGFMPPAKMQSIITKSTKIRLVGKLPENSSGAILLKIATMNSKGQKTEMPTEIINVNLRRNEIASGNYCQPEGLAEHNNDVSLSDYNRYNHTLKGKVAKFHFRYRKDRTKGNRNSNCASSSATRSIRKFFYTNKEKSESNDHKISVVRKIRDFAGGPVSARVKLRPNGPGYERISALQNFDTVVTKNACIVTTLSGVKERVLIAREILD